MIGYRHKCPTFKNKYILKAPKGWGKSEHRAKAGSSQLYSWIVKIIKNKNKMLLNSLTRSQAIWPNPDPA